MKFRMSIIAVVFAVCMMLSGCSWVTGGNSLFLVLDYEARRLADVFGDDALDHIDSGRLTDDEFRALMAYRAGADQLLEKYYLYDMKIESFHLMPDDTYEIVFTCDGTPFTCWVHPVADGYECFDDFEPVNEHKN